MLKYPALLLVEGHFPRKLGTKHKFYAKTFQVSPQKNTPKWRDIQGPRLLILTLSRDITAKEKWETKTRNYTDNNGILIAQSSSDDDDLVPTRVSDDEGNFLCDFCGLKYFNQSLALKGEWVICRKH